MRFDYVDAFISQPGILFQYEYLYKNVYFRIEGKLTPDQATKYEAAFVSIQDGDLPAQFTE